MAVGVTGPKPRPVASYFIFGMLIAVLCALAFVTALWGVSDKNGRKHSDCVAELQGQALTDTILIFDVPSSDQAARQAAVAKAVHSAKRAQRADRYC